MAAELAFRKEDEDLGWPTMHIEGSMIQGYRELEWAAGFLEAEGCLHRPALNEPQVVPIVTASEVMRWRLDRLATYFGGTITQRPARGRDQPFGFGEFGDGGQSACVNSLPIHVCKKATTARQVISDSSATRQVLRQW